MQHQSHSQRAIVGRYLTRGGSVGNPVGLPIDALDRHFLICGETGTGKTQVATKALTTAHLATDGPTIVLDPKGEDWPRELARAHYMHRNSLDDVLLFDIAEMLPAISVFDIRPDLEAGIPRERAVEDLTMHFLELLEHVKPGGFDAIRSPDIIQYLLAALFDPVHGDDAFPLADLLDALYRLDNADTVPDVSTDWQEKLLANLTTLRASTSEQIVQGAITRVEKFEQSSYLRPLFNYIPSDHTDAFSFDSILSEDVLVIIDCSGPQQRTQRVLANLLLSMLWRALQRRDRTDDEDPLALLCVDEVPALRVDAPLQRLLSMGREHGIGVIPMMQYPGQLDRGAVSGATTDTDAYHEVINNCHSVLAGGVSDADGLAAKFSGSHMSTAEVENRLTNMPPDRWFFQPAKLRSVGTIQSHVIAEPRLPAGHPDGPAPLPESDQAAFDEEFAACRNRTCDVAGLEYETTASRAGSVVTTETPLAQQRLQRLQKGGFTTTLPLLESLPGSVMYDAEPHALICGTCGANRSPTERGLLDSMACHGDLAAVERDAIPPVELHLSLTPDEIEATPIDMELLCALQVLYNVSQGVYPTVAVDRVFDGTNTVLSHMGIDSNDLTKLKDEGLITIDKLHRRSYHTVTPEGRDLLNRPHRKGVEWGHGRGDNTETLLHQVMVEALVRHIDQRFVNDPESPVERVVPYVNLDKTDIDVALSGHVRFDVIGFDSEGRPVVIGEAERANNDRAKAAVEDFDQIAAVDPDHALWLVPSTGRGRTAVLKPLADPPDGEQRLREYSDSTRIEEISVAKSAGMTEITTLGALRKELPEPPSPVNHSVSFSP